MQNSISLLALVTPFALMSLVARAQDVEGPRTAKTEVVRPEGATASFRTPFVFTGNHILFRAKVNGQDVWSLLDNQAEHSLISDDLAASLGVKAEGSAKPLISAQGSSTMVPTGPVEILILGQAKFRMRIFSANLVGATTVVGEKVDLTLGADLFKGLGV